MDLREKILANIEKLKNPMMGLDTVRSVDEVVASITDGFGNVYEQALGTVGNAMDRALRLRINESETVIHLRTGLNTPNLGDMVSVDTSGLLCIGGPHRSFIVGSVVAVDTFGLTQYVIVRDAQGNRSRFIVLLDNRYTDWAGPR